VLAGYRRPQDIETLDNDFDASTPCTVARRASIAQGRALLTVWERGFKSVYTASSFAGTQSTHKGDLDENVPKTQQTPGQDTERDDAIAALKAFNLALRTTDYLSGHLPPLWGLVTRILNIPLREAAYLFLFSHARTILSAAVRASVMGPYQAQAVLASLDTQERIRGLVEEGWDRETEDAGQCVPVMDIWVGRHERLYSRIFNS
jgi:urease accessory protein